MLKLHNTLTRKTEELKPIKQGMAGLYTCGPTVYDFAHIGNLRTYVFEDLLSRVLAYNKLNVIHAMNITDVGHLTSDADEGEDKMEKGAKREGKPPLEIARRYEDQFFKDIEALNIIKPSLIARATDTIAEQIEIIKILESKGFIYKDDAAIYFDTSKLSDYGKLSGQKLDDKKIGARDEVVVDIQKRNPQDFVLWFFLTGRYKDHVLQWDSPWGKGFPGWHIECSAISKKLLGQPFDIHTGGVDHIGTHHTNEIAQSEAAFGVPLANVWMHGEFLLIDEGRMGKSEGNAYVLKTVIEKGFHPLDLRYLYLTAHYRSQLNFTWESLQAAHTALERLYDFARTADAPKVGCAEYEQLFLDAVNDDLNIPKALGITWELVGDKNFPSAAKMQTLLKFDEVLGLGLGSPPKIEVPSEVEKLMNQRQIARTEKDFKKSDELRDEIAEIGFEVSDTSDGQKVKKI